MRIYYCIPMIILLSACKSGPNERKVGTHEAVSDQDMKYSDSVSGWSTQYPKSWPVLTAQEIAAAEKRGVEMLELDSQEKLPITNKQMLWLRKDDLNSFTSNYEFFDERDGSYPEVEKAIFEMIESSFTKLGLQIDSQVDTATLDGLEFIRYQATIYSGSRSSVIMNQVMYCRLIDNRISIILNANYNNPRDRDALLSILEASRFSIRD